MHEKPIALGRATEIFDWHPGQILKLYREWCPVAWVEQEAELTRAVCAAGVPAPTVIDLVERDGRRGIVFEQIAGPSMLAEFGKRPWHLIRSAHPLAELHATMHAREISALPPLDDSLVYRVTCASVSDTVKTTALNTLARLPTGTAVCRGNLHPDNIILSPRGPVIINWMIISCRWRN